MYVGLVQCFSQLTEVSDERRWCPLESVLLKIFSDRLFSHVSHCFAEVDWKSRIRTVCGKYLIFPKIWGHTHAIDTRLAFPLLQEPGYEAILDTRGNIFRTVLLNFGSICMLIIHSAIGFTMALVSSNKHLILSGPVHGRFYWYMYIGCTCVQVYQTFVVRLAC